MLDRALIGLAIFGVIIYQQPAFARLGGSPSQAAALAKPYKQSGAIAGTSFWVKGGKVIAEDWSSPKPFSLATADRLRGLIVGNKPLERRYRDGGALKFIYRDGTKVNYQLDFSDKAVTSVEAYAPGYSMSDLFAAGKGIIEYKDWGKPQVRINGGG